MKEFWLDIKDYEDYYQSSTFGRVRSLDTYRKGKNGTVKFYRGRILKPVTDKNGYLYVNLYKNGKVKKFLVHRLVAEAFLPNPDNLPEVNHKDENKTNNVVSNLEWCDRTYNNTYGTRNERDALTKSKPVVQYTLDGQFVREWKSTRECERNGYNHGHVAECCRGKLKKYKDSIWRYK